MDNHKSKHPIVGFVADLFFVSRIENVALGVGYPLQWFERIEQVAVASLDTPFHPLTEYQSVPNAELLGLLTHIQPSLVIFDLSNTEIPWKEWIAVIKSDPATRRIPVICFGSHVDIQGFQAAKHAGADYVFPRSVFVRELPRLIGKYAHIPDYEGIDDACDELLSDVAKYGLMLFNKGEYFEAHEYLEEAWKEDNTPGRELYRAILQVAVAYLQIERKNYNSALKMFLRLRQWMYPLPGKCRGVNIDQLREDIFRVQQVLIALGKERIGEFDRQMFKPVIYVETV